jgi:hypothetical protein
LPTLCKVEKALSAEKCAEVSPSDFLFHGFGHSVEQNKACGFHPLKFNFQVIGKKQKL